eukprot:TRINITY_DN3745_c0_g1_i6.p1 TRINITY_DN3745_c0_g1~~TRINITY_DN3745_c0_g1_i6.p1  ORF type:complete len:380 (+),score=57.02 TRINITY_DN3745_c0_g1_i6:82-1140(+)
MEEEVQRKCSLLCLDVPERTELGIDLYVFHCGPKFKGIKLIPPGLHFVYFSGQGNQGGQGAPRTGFFLYLKSGQTEVRRWNPQTEDFQSDMLEEETQRFAEGVQRFEFDTFLGPYPESENKRWIDLCNYITPSVLQHLEPIKKEISGIYDVGEDGKDPASGLTTSPSELKSSHRPYFSSVPKRKLVVGASASQITQDNMDKSAILFDLINKRYKDNPNELLGELQFAFICFLLGESFDGLEQWKSLTMVLCCSDAAVPRMPDFFIEFMVVLQAQLNQAPTDFFVDPLAGNNFLVHSLKTFFLIVSEAEVGGKFAQKFASFRKFIEGRFGSDFIADVDGGIDEDAPGVVETED